MACTVITGLTAIVLFCNDSGRIALAITTLLTMGTQAFATFSNNPSASYIKAIDIWMGGCLLAVFLALVEFAVVHLVHTRAKNVAAQQVINVNLNI